MAMGIIAVGSAVLGAGASIYAANKNAGIASDAADKADEERKKQQGLLDIQKKEYKSMKFENVYSNMENPYAENVYEDLTVNQQQAQFQSEQGAQQRANIMGGLRGAAGSSGIAGLAQSLANQGQLQTQQISASIGQQEARNQMLAAKGAQQVQRGAEAVQVAKLGGEQWVQQQEIGRTETLLGMQYGAASGANTASANAQANQMQAQMGVNNAWASGIGDVATSIAGADFGGGGDFEFARNYDKKTGITSGGFGVLNK